MRCGWFVVLVAAFVLGSVPRGVAAQAAATQHGAHSATTRATSGPVRRTGVATSNVSAAATKQVAPDVVVLKELVDLYEPVPFDHKAHAGMSEMWNGCVACHHREPEATTRPTTTAVETERQHPKQDDSTLIPACKSCHAARAEVASSADIRMPNLKGAYHRQCLACHRDWAHENACGACHKPRQRGVAAVAPVTPDDIVGRMHPPIQEPEVMAYRARFTPVGGAKVLFRHKEHTTKYGLTCANCHRDDNCSRCHAERAVPAATSPAARPLPRFATWAEAHDPCARCHAGQPCATCHYDDEAVAPKPFRHESTGQVLDKDHADLKCTQCHADPFNRRHVTCGTAGCHHPASEEDPITFPLKRPGPTVEKPPAPAAPVARRDAGSYAATTMPTTRATVFRIRYREPS